jgi:type 1 glutamine amidotransferase
MRRREMLASCGAAALGLSVFPLGWVAAEEKKKQKVLYFTRSAGFEHSAVQRTGGELGYSEKVLTEMGKRAGFEVECSKDGRVFDGDLDQYDLIAFYTSGDLTQPNKQQTPPMTPKGKQKLLRTIAAGKGFVGFHSASDSFHSRGRRDETQRKVDPYIAMLGGEFVTHGAQQEAAVLITSPNFPGVRDLRGTDRLVYNEEWYTLKNFAKDLHVILVQQTEGMKGDCYQRPPFPCMWAHLHGKGRVFYTSFAHRHDVWDQPAVQKIILGGMAWAMGNVDAEIKPNIEQVTPKANQLHN